MLRRPLISFKYLHPVQLGFYTLHDFYFTYLINCPYKPKYNRCIAYHFHLYLNVFVSDVLLHERFLCHDRVPAEYGPRTLSDQSFIELSLRVYPILVLLQLLGLRFLEERPAQDLDIAQD